MTWVFWIAAATVIYAFVGYAVWLWIRSKWAPWPVRRGVIEPAVSVVMVVRNEETVIERKMQNLLSLHYAQEKLEVVVVSDGSTDRTTEILRSLRGNKRV